MAAELVVRLYSSAGAQLAVVTDYTALSYTRKVNDIGLMTFTLREDSVNASAIDIDVIATVWRRDVAAGVSWYIDYYGLIRAIERRYTDHAIITATAQTAHCLLARRIVAYYAGQNNLTEFTNQPAETIAKRLVNYNAASAATVANGRMRAGAITGLTVAADGAQGNTISGAFSWDNLLSALQFISGDGNGGIDFDVVRNATGWEFRTYAPDLGADRTATVLFSLGRGNMANPVITENRIDERTVAIVGGPGEESSRAVSVVTGTDYPEYDLEVFVDARSEDSATLRTTLGDVELVRSEVVRGVEFDVLQSPATLYGRDYFLGDRVSWEYGEQSGTLKVWAVTVSIAENGKEDIAVELSNA